MCIKHGTRQQLDKLTLTELSLLSARVQLSTTVSDLGVLVDGQLSEHGRSCRITVSVVFFSVAPASTCEVVTDRRLC